MDEETKKAIKEKFDSLPESIQGVILSSNYQDNLMEIAQKHHLNVEQMGILERETTLVMMGLIPTEKFQAELTRELNVEPEKGFQIATDLNEKIFLRIRELLKLMNTPPGEEPTVEENVAGRKEAPSPQLKTESSAKIETREDMMKILETPELAPAPQKINNPIAEQKLSAPTQTATIKTEHSPENITKTVPTPPPSASYPRGADPYREMPK